jgi:hypothetical protein
MKLLSLIFGLVLALAAAGKAQDYSGVYVAADNMISQTLDLSSAGRALHTIDVKGTENLEAIAIIKAFEIKRATWAPENGKIHIRGFYKKESGEEQEAIVVLDIEPNGDLIRNDPDGNFVRFQKR